MKMQKLFQTKVQNIKTKMKSQTDIRRKQKESQVKKNRKTR